VVVTSARSTEPLEVVMTTARIPLKDIKFYRDGMVSYVVRAAFQWRCRGCGKFIGTLCWHVQVAGVWKVLCLKCGSPEGE